MKDDSLVLKGGARSYSTDMCISRREDSNPRMKGGHTRYTYCQQRQWRNNTYGQISLLKHLYFVLGWSVRVYPMCLLYNIVSKLLVAWREIPWTCCVDASISLDDRQQGMCVRYFR